MKILTKDGRLKTVTSSENSISYRTPIGFEDVFCEKCGSTVKGIELFCHKCACDYPALDCQEQKERNKNA